MKQSVALAAGFFIGLGGLTAARAAVLTASADAFVNSRATTTNASNTNGTTSLLVKKNTSNGLNRVAFIGFNTSPLFTTVSGAMLNLTVDNPGGVAGEVVELYALPEGTPENIDLSTITWATASTASPAGFALVSSSSTTNVNGSSPTSSSAQAATYNYLTYLDSLTFAAPVTPGTVLSFDSDALTRYLSEDTNGLSMFVLTSETPSGSGNFTVAGVGSTIAAAPTLVTHAPEPGMLALPATAAALLTGRRRLRR